MPSRAESALGLGLLWVWACPRAEGLDSLRVYFPCFFTASPRWGQAHCELGSSLPQALGVGVCQTIDTLDW